MAESAHSIDKQNKTDHCKLVGILDGSDISRYFQMILDEVPENGGYRELVDFTEIEKFSVTSDEFNRLYYKIVIAYETKRLLKTKFLVSTQLQKGMANMFSLSTGEIRNIFEIETIKEVI